MGSEPGEPRRARGQNLGNPAAYGEGGVGGVWCYSLVYQVYQAGLQVYGYNGVLTYLLEASRGKYDDNCL
eukprot:8388503-Pyramimonas_sp.AAC.1